MSDKKKLCEEGIFSLDIDKLDTLDEMEFFEDNVFDDNDSFTNHRMYPECSNVFQALSTVNVSEMKTIEGNSVGDFLENLVF